jgi:tetratricopeptide (TPR) repeat protein
MDYRAQLWLGQVLAASGQRSAQAEEHLRKAVALGKTAPETWVALVRYLASTNQVQAAETVIREAQSNLAAEHAPLALAQCYAALQRYDDAHQHFQAALKAKPDDRVVLRSAASFYVRLGRFQDAEPVLRTVVDRKTRVSEGDVAWARRNLAMVVAAGRDYAKFREALNLVGLTLDAAGKVRGDADPAAQDTPEDLRARARVLATQPRGHFRSKAIALLEELNRRQPLAPDDQFLLARLYEEDNQWPKARDQFRSLLASPESTFQHLSHYAYSLLRRGEAEEAHGYIDRLAKSETTPRSEAETYGLTTLQALALEARGRVDEGIKLLQAHVEKLDTPPEASLLLVSRLARQKRTKEALDWCERLWQRCPPTAVGGASVAVLRAATPSQEQCDRVERWLTDAMQKHPAETALLLQMADLCDLQGRYQEAELLYRRVLERDAANALALNNLAWLLTQHAGNTVEALPMINRAIELLGKRPELLDTRATVFLVMGRSDLAVADLEELAADQPTAPRYLQLARAHRLANNPAAAAKAYRQAKDAGLEMAQFHPLERSTLRKTIDELEQR